MSDYKHIWSHDEDGRSRLSEAQLLAYLEGRLPESERRAVEELLSNEGMESDALEGLQTLSAGETKKLKYRLDADLQKALRKKRRGRRGISEQHWTWTAIGIILLLAIMCYAVIYLVKHSGK
jgi:anti-sigma factor RsiW